MASHLLGKKSLLTLTFGFFGIQFGFALQNANLSRIFESLGASIKELPLLWIAAPVTGILVQPLIGLWSDRTLSKFGRRRPFIAIGALLSTFALVALPFAPTLAVAIVAVWVLDASINMCMEPLRTLVADSTTEEQVTQAFAWQSFFIALGSVVGSALPWLLSLVLPETEQAAIGPQVKWAFIAGAVFFGGAVLYSVLNTPEKPLSARPARQNYPRNIGKAFAGLSLPVWHIGAILFFAWFGLFLLWVYTTPAVALGIFKSPDPQSLGYQKAGDQVGLAFAIYNGSAALVALSLGFLKRKIGGYLTLALCLGLGAISLVGLSQAEESWHFFLSMLFFGPAWAAILALPYSLVRKHLPAEEMGLHFGLLNLFIVAPQVISSLLMGPLLDWGFNSDPRVALLLSGLCFLVAAGFSLLGNKQSTQTIVIC